MKPIFFLVASFPDSIVQFRGALISDLQRLGWQVHVAAPDLAANSSVRQELIAKGVTVHTIPLRRTGTNAIADIVLLCRLVWLMLEVRPAVFLGYTVKPVVYGSLAAWIARVPHRFALVTGLGYAFTASRPGFISAVIKRLYALALARVGKVFFQNPDDERLFRNTSLLHISTPSTVVNGSGVDVSHFEQKGLESAGTTFLLIARLLGDKGVREYVHAARYVRSVQPDARFLLVGWIDENPDAIKQSELDGWIAEGSIEFLGRMKDVRPAIGMCSIYVLPSYREGTPRTVLEAMAMGRAVITTDAPGCRETVIDGVNGFLVPVRSAVALADAMLRFVEEPGLAAEMGKRSRQLAEEKYDVHKVNAVMLREMNI